MNRLTRIFDACEAVEAICELQEGTLLGAVKFGTILPWERDADVMVHSKHVEKLVAELKTRKLTAGISKCESELLRRNFFIKAFFFRTPSEM